LFNCKFDFCFFGVGDINQLFSSFSSCSRNQKSIAMDLFHILIKPMLFFDKCIVFSFCSFMVNRIFIVVVVVVVKQQ